MEAAAALHPVRTERQAIDAVITLGGMNDYYLFRPWERERLEYPVNNFLAVNPLVADDNFGDTAIGWVLGRIAGGVERSHARPIARRLCRVPRRWRPQPRDGPPGSRPNTRRSRACSPCRRISRATASASSPGQLELLEKYNRAMEALARDYDIRTAYFFQPVPAYGKTLTTEEQAVVGDLSYLSALSTHGRRGVAPTRPWLGRIRSR